MDPAPIASAPTLWEWLRELVSDVLPVVIGGALAIGGSVATMWMQRRASTNDFKKKKIEELVSLSDELQISLGEITRYAFDASEKHPEGVSPWQKMHVICKLYFRELLPQLKKVEAAKDMVHRIALAKAKGSLSNEQALAAYCKSMDALKTEKESLVEEAAEIGKKL